MAGSVAPFLRRGAAFYTVYTVMAGRSPGHPRRSARTGAAAMPRSLCRHGRRRPTIHEFGCHESAIASIWPRPGTSQDVDGRDKPGHDEWARVG